MSAPSLHRANRTYMTFLVNRRLVQSRTLSYALEEAYQGFLPQRRYPMAVLSLQVPTAQVDANVHPGQAGGALHPRGAGPSRWCNGRCGRRLVGSSPIPEVRLDRRDVAVISRRDGPRDGFFSRWLDLLAALKRDAPSDDAPEGGVTGP